MVMVSGKASEKGSVASFRVRRAAASVARARLRLRLPQADDCGCMPSTPYAIDFDQSMQNFPAEALDFSP